MKKMLVFDDSHCATRRSHLAGFVAGGSGVADELRLGRLGSKSP